MVIFFCQVYVCSLRLLVSCFILIVFRPVCAIFSFAAPVVSLI